jgi:outer membrane lipoprotein-sorting protein
LVTYTVSSVEYNTALPDAVFPYMPPAQSTVVPSAAELKSALSRALAK